VRGVSVKTVSKILDLSKDYIPGKRLTQAILTYVVSNLVLFNLATTQALSQTDNINTNLQPQAGGAQPALNVVNPPTRAPLAPPPETPSDNLQGAQAIAVQKGATPVSLPQAWRLKAFSLFKAGTASDKNNNIISVKLAGPYRSSFEAARKALTDNNLNIDALSLSAGHILISLAPNDGGGGGAGVEKAIIAMRQSATDSGTDVRISCETKNRTLTMAMLKQIFDGLSGGSGDLNNRNGANSL
jgi:hypothetical protein